MLVASRSVGINFAGMKAVVDAAGNATVSPTLPVQNTFVQPTAPTVESGVPYAWFQTGLGADGSGVTLWLEDGK